MGSTLNISLPEDQKKWLQARREARGFASTSDVVRDLIRARQEQEQTELLGHFRQLNGDGSDEAEPVEAVLKIVKRVKTERRGQAERGFGQLGHSLRHRLDRRRSSRRTQTSCHGWV